MRISAVSIALLFFVLLASALAVQDQQPPPIFGSAGGGRPQRLVRLKPHQQAALPGLACQTINYYGVVDKVAVPSFDGVTSTGWVGGDSVEIGGQAQFVPPQGSPPYAAVFYNSTTNTITFPTPMALVSYLYATAYDTIVTGYDVNGKQVAQTTASGNWDHTSVYVNWSPVTLTTNGNQISSVTIASNGPVLSNFLGIDDLQYCLVPAINSVEMTQSIQQLQTFGALQSSLAANGQPPVPVIAGKWGAMRVYMNPVYAATAVKVTLAVTGMPPQPKTVNLVPGCLPTTQRYQSNTCSSVDFYFPAPSGAWTATLAVTDPSTGYQIEQHQLPFVSQTTLPLVLSSVSVCDETAFFSCGDASALFGLTNVLWKIAPTYSVTPSSTGNKVTLSYVDYVCPPHCRNPTDQAWWDKVVAEIGRQYLESQGGAPGTYTVYFGMVRPIATIFAGWSNFLSHQAASKTSDLEYKGTVDEAAEDVAHETGHTLNLHHTNTQVPKNTVNPPGCADLARDKTSTWPYPDNYLQSSTPAKEVGFDVALHHALDPMMNFDIMSYCEPQWTTPFTAVGETTTLSTGAAAPAPRSDAETARPRTLATGAFWIVTGSIPASGPAQFDPIFQRTIQADTGGGAGAYSLQVQDANSAVLFTRHFDLGLEQPEADSTDPEIAANFVQAVPVVAAAARIVLLDPTNAILTYVNLGGTAPTVAITSPTAAFDGSQPISWTITDPDSSDFLSRVYYSPNNGQSWSEVAQIPDSGTSVSVDFSALPGAIGQGLIKVLVSDGANTGQAVSPAFSISKKTPLVQILSPTPNFSQAAIDPVLFTGTAFDADDGALSGASLAWSSNLQGPLGTGSPLAVSLQPGVHTITLTATDSDNNSISAGTTVTIGGQPPLLNVSFNTLSAPPSNASTCIQATVNAASSADGAPLRSAQYSVDGGNTYTGIPVNQLPFTFVIPGTGYVSLVFSATDTSSQLTVESATYFSQQPCGSLLVPNVVGMTLANAASALANAALVAGAATQAASATVASGSVISQTPVAGSTIAPGVTDAVNVVVSAGPQIAIPNVVGQSQANAAAALAGAGLALGTVTVSTSVTVTAGNVIGETPSAGTVANAGTSVNLTVSSGSGLAISAPAVLPAATLAFPYSTVLTASGGSGNYGWSAPGLPAGLAIDNSGTISGTPSGASGSSSVQVTLTDNTYATTTNRSYSLAINPALAVASPASLPNGTVGAGYPATTLKAMGGSNTYTWSATGLPSGMILNAATGVISGKLQSDAGSPYGVEVTVEDSNFVLAAAAYTLTVVRLPLAISGPASLPEGFAGVPYPATTITASGGSGNYSWSAGGLPNGLSIDPVRGILSGTPTTATGSPFSVTVTVNDGNTTANFPYSLVVSPFSPCDANQSGTVTVADVQRMINEAMGLAAPAQDLNGDGVVNTVDVEIVINDVLGLGCSGF